MEDKKIWSLLPTNERPTYNQKVKWAKYQYQFFLITTSQQNYKFLFTTIHRFVKPPTTSPSLSSAAVRSIFSFLSS